MTFSLLAFEPRTGTIGCAAATGNLAVGGWVLRAAARVGAVATQGMSVSSLWGDEAMARLAGGEGADEVVAALTGGDPGRDHRQLAVLDRNGRTAAWTGEMNMDDKAHIVADGCVLAGNWLASDQVLSNMRRAFTSADANDMGERLLAALDAGVAAGSDARGTVSAALRIVRPDQAPVDFRVDQDELPVARLRRVYELSLKSPYSDWVRRVPTLDDPHRC